MPLWQTALFVVSCMSSAALSASGPPTPPNVFLLAQGDQTPVTPLLIQHPISSSTDNMSAQNGYRAVAYFVNWAIYGRQHHPQDLPAERLTHVLYAFANVRPETGEVYLTDKWSDLDKHYDDDSWNDPGGPNMYGCFKRLALLKRKNRNLKTLLSIGGWTYSANFAPAAATAQARGKFAETAVTLLKDGGFDGLDIDWEYPQDDTQARHFVELLSETRTALDNYAAGRGQPKGQYLLTVACPAGPENFSKLHVREMDKFLDFWNLMAYDYSGGWDHTTGHQANWRPSPEVPLSTPFSTEAALNYYVKKEGVDAQKMVIGFPLYGRSFAGTDGPGRPFQEVGEGTWERGVVDWKKLPFGAGTHYDAHAVASWMYNSNARTMVTVDSEMAMKEKTKLVREGGLGGVMWWESSADRKLGQGSAIELVTDNLKLGGGAIEQRQNVIEYPDSVYENLRGGFQD